MLSVSCMFSYPHTRNLYGCQWFLGIQPVPLQTITNESTSGPSLGTTPQARFLLVALSMLTLQHGANTLSLLLNSGTLALTQTALRLIGRLPLPSVLYENVKILPLSLRKLFLIWQNTSNIKFTIVTTLSL